ncbi:MAG: NAD(P)/FAD-dependent oxidoreductase, partial [Candidatus Zixiibacteriota bacterium]
MKYVVIGNGVAGINAAARIRLKDTSADITVISQESDHFFSRTALMYVFCGQMSVRDIEPFERDYYQKMNFQRVRDEVLGLIASTKTLQMRNGMAINYDRLLIAAGSVPRMVGWPGQDLDGVCNFVTMQNLELMKKQAKTTKKACVVGGGLIGIEAVEVLLMAGIEVSFVIRESHYWPVALDKTEGALITERMKEHGCDVRLNTECKEVLGKEGKVIGLLTDDGETINCDMVVFAIGVRPQTDWLKDSGVNVRQVGLEIVIDNNT